MVPLNEKFEKKIVCTFDYIDNEIVEDEVNQELVKKIVFGEDRMLEKKMIAAKEEISNLKDQERALRYIFKSEMLTKSIWNRSIVIFSHSQISQKGGFKAGLDSEGAPEIWK